MEAKPSLILRFRNFAENIDTIAAHRDVLEHRGRVLWGWWRKAFEANPQGRLRQLAGEVPFSVALIDVTEREQALATVARLHLETHSVEQELVPSYYWHVHEEIDTWFELAALEDVRPFDEELAQQLSVPTIYHLDWVGDKAKATPFQSGAETSPQTQNKILRVQAPEPITKIDEKERTSDSKPFVLLHLSDLHFGSDHNFKGELSTETMDNRRTLARAIVEDCQRQDLVGNIDVVVVTGDITTRGKWTFELRNEIAAFFESLRSGLRIENEQFVICPGNHDFERYSANNGETHPSDPIEEAVNMKHEDGLRLIRERALGIAYDAPFDFVKIYTAGQSDVRIAVLNSCNITAIASFTEYGFVKGEGIEAIRDVAKDAEPLSIRLAILHHHIVPIVPMENVKTPAVSVTLNASEIIEELQRSSVQLILHGHQHHAAITRLGRLGYRGLQWTGLDDADTIFVLSGGSAGSKHVPPVSGNCYGIIKFLGDGGTLVTVRRLLPDGTSLPDYMSANIPVVPNKRAWRG
jgi:3',5'-cyclic AMP phosphodiesterase CpdA